MDRKNTGKSSLPWWTWILPFFVFYVAARISVWLVAPSGSLLFYLPIPIGIILIHWWGPRVLLGLFVNSIVVSAFWEMAHTAWQPLTLFHDFACVLTSWFLFSYKQNGKAWLPDILNVLQFIALGIIIPVTINSAFIFLVSFSRYDNIGSHLMMVWTADFTSSLAVTLPVLFFLTPGMERLGLTRQQGSEYIKPSTGLRLVRPRRNEIAIFFFILITLSLILPVEKYWFIHGLFCVFIGVRFGFALSLLANFGVFFFTYVAPFLTSSVGKFSWLLETDLLNIHFGMCLLGMTACITGRVISDLKSVEKKVNTQFKELERTHDELDRFVYSASHDLSAPLKTILGLITVSRLESNPLRLIDYIDKIEISAKKLDDFIKEILDYSRNSRLEKSAELINLRDMVDEVFKNFQHHERLPEIDIKILDDQAPQIVADRMRMKIILNNLISNAIKYQHYNNGHTPSIIIQSELNHHYVMIHVKDNGHGIKEEYMSKIFNMFFRGSLDSTGSGLGLYIAKEAVEKMDGKISVDSHPGKGSVFTVFLPKN